MSLVAVYDALKAASVPDEKARSAVEAIEQHIERARRNPVRHPDIGSQPQPVSHWREAWNMLVSTAFLLGMASALFLLLVIQDVIRFFG